MGRETDKPLNQICRLRLSKMMWSAILLNDLTSKRHKKLVIPFAISTSSGLCPDFQPTSQEEKIYIEAVGQRNI